MSSTGSSCSPGTLHGGLFKSRAAASFRDSTWKTRWIILSLAVLLTLRAVMLLRAEGRSALPWWLVLVASVIAPQLFMLFLPITTRVPQAPLPLPTLRRCWIEFLVALPVVIAIASTILGLEFAVSIVAPGKSIMPDQIRRMAESPNQMAVYAFMILTCTLAPISEELFFRGFLQNAFRARMPRLFATSVQCLIFGFGHTFGIVHAIGACVIGVILTALYEWRQTLITPAMVHAGLNFLSAIALGWAIWAFSHSPILGVTCGVGPTCVVQGVLPNSAASRAGIQEGDVIITFGTEQIHDFAHLVETVRRYRPDDRIPLAIERDGLPMNLEVVLGRRNEQEFSSGRGYQPPANER
jgi:membrane protease YdiL (CAAX protease family)